MSDIVLITSIPTFFICIAAVALMRRSWKNALCAALATGLSISVIMNMEENVRLYVLEHRSRTQYQFIKELQQQLDDAKSKLNIQKTEINHAQN